MDNRFYNVCSYGGSGSWMLVKYLQKFHAIARHIHSRKPPIKLTQVGTPNHTEWFGNNIIHEPNLSMHTVIFIYRNPVDVIYSRCMTTPNRHRGLIPEHLYNIQAPNSKLCLDDVLESGKDLWGFEEFYDNYTTFNPDRNYPIYCVKYEEFFDNIPVFNSKIHIPNQPQHFPHKIETKKQVDPGVTKRLTEIYSNLINKQKQMPFIKII